MNDELHFIPVVVLEIPALGVNLCPPGVAGGFSEFSNRGVPGPEITVWPKTHSYALWDGGPNNPRPIIRVKGVRMWNQELAVYFSERKKSIGAMIEELGLSHMLPRVGGTENLLEPRPEDFRLEWEPWECIKCSHKWDRVKGEKPRERCPACKSGWWQQVTDDPEFAEEPAPEPPPPALTAETILENQSLRHQSGPGLQHRNPQ